MSRNITSEEMDRVIDYLQGTCLSLDEGICHVLGDEGIEEMRDIDNELEFCARIDDNIFLCESCGWWYGAGEWIDDSHPNWEDGREVCTSCGDE